MGMVSRRVEDFYTMKHEVDASSRSVDTQTDLQSCGGCWNDGSGIDCTELSSNRNRDAVQCIQGRCIGELPGPASHGRY